VWIVKKAGRTKASAGDWNSNSGEEEED